MLRKAFGSTMDTKAKWTENILGKKEKANNEPAGMAMTRRDVKIAAKATNSSRREIWAAASLGADSPSKQHGDSPAKQHNGHTKQHSGGGGGGGKRRGGATAGGKLRAALVLHGKLGAIDRGQGWTRAVDGAAPTMDLVVACYASVARHIVAANRAEASVDVFGHSWSPELGTALDALFQPKAAAHEKDEVLRNRQLCTQVSKMLRNYTSSPGYGAPFIHYAAVGRGANSCERTANHLLGMQRAIGLKAKYEAAHRFTYDVVLVSRWDVLWNRPLLLSRLDLSRHGFTVPTFCTHARGVDHKSDVERSLTAFRRRVPSAGHALLAI